jgi:hypothetical protein
MAITIHQEPPLISPVYSPMFYTTSSSYSFQDNFKYSYDLQDLNGVVVSKKVLPFPNDLGRIDVSKLLTPFLSNDLQFNSTGITSCSNSLKQYDLYIGHTGSTTTYTPTSTGIKFALNAVDYIYDYTLNKPIDSTFVDRFMMTTGLGHFLTNQKNVVDIYKDEYFTLTFLNGYFSSTQKSYAEYAKVVFYTSSGGGTSYIENEDYVPTPTGMENVDVMIKSFGCGYKNLYGIPNIASYLDANDVKYYTITLVNSSFQNTSETWRFNVINDTTKYPKHQFCFLNRLGGWSYFSFKGKTYEETKIQKENFIKNDYYLNADSQWVTDASMRTNTTYNINMESEYTFNSDYIDQPTFNFLVEMVTSPEVYWIKDDVALPINITDETWSNKQKINEKEISFSIKATLSNKKKKINI